ncbi:MAG: hypothetical protein QF837_01540 [Acidimicrobiales bacterium]|nr:hypothetical protein [Acidimicrobiaceae bacterium]MDP6161344.1 hypothetical protein [Acidimicrobiales bacterium]MDP6285914.1 hypothetical protein [Acidimicrobiales bacterium]HJL91115.1 hypothetical protein [Acidimicrobiales bacterium]HJO41264.1 hypothetical protein [Acidimicrobiales bacterium]
MVDLLTTLGGISWDLEVRGILVVAVGTVVLIGSVWLIIATNSGARLSTLVTFAGLMGFMTILGISWWLYGSGWKGADPSWRTIDINVGDLKSSALIEARDLPNPEDLSSAYEMVVQSQDEAANLEFNKLPTESDYPELSLEDLAEIQADKQLRNETITHSELAAVSPNLTKSYGLDDLNGWRLLSTAESGDAQAQAIADVLAQSDLGFGSTSEFKVLDSYTFGGKPELKDNPNRWDRISLWATNTARITHPIRYAVVQFQRVIDQPSIPGMAPPRPVIDKEEPVVSTIMVRDLGTRRLRPALVTIGSFIIFLALCYWLHVRDKELMAKRQEFASSIE